MCKLICVAVSFSQDSFPLRLQCVINSSAGAAFRTTRSGSSPTFAYRTEQVDCIISCNCAINLMAGTAGIAAESICMSSTFRTEPRTMTTMTLSSTYARLALKHLLLGFRNCLSIISAQNTATQSPMGVATTGRAIVAGCVSRKVNMQGTTPTWAWKSPGV